VPIVSATRASSLAVVLVTTTGFAGGGGWMAGRAPAPVAAVDVASVDEAAHEHAGHSGHAADDSSSAKVPAPAPAAAESHGEHHAHHAHHAPEPSAARADSAPKHHGHDCEKGICRCDSRCPARRSGHCGGALRSCSGDGQDSGLAPGPLRPFLLSSVAVLAPGFEHLGQPDPPFVAVTRSLEPVSPPPRTSSI
jgi:hypothetical protein